METDQYATKHEFNFGLDLLKATKTYSAKPSFVLTEAQVPFAKMGRLMVLFALHLHAKGVKRGSLVSLSSMDAVTHFAMFGAVSLLGGISVWGTQAALRSNLKIAFKVHARKMDTPVTKTEIRVDESWSRLPEGVTDVSGLAFKGYPSPDAPAMIYQTSGSSGTPKFLVGTAKNVTDRIWARFALDMAAPERQLLLTPVGAHMFLTETARSFVVGAQTSVGLPPEVAFARKIDRVFGSPRQLETWLGAYIPGTGEKLKMAYSTGAETQVPARRRLLECFDTVRIGYGSAELGAAVCGHLIDATTVGDRTVGRILRGASVEIVDENDAPLPVGEEGMIRAKAPTMVSRYLGDAARTAKVFRDGWVYSGDIGRITDNGCLELVGRQDHRMNFGGMKLDALTLERIVSQVAGVVECACFSYGEADHISARLGLAVVSDDTVPQSDLIESISRECSTRMGPFAVPSEVLFLDEMPLGATGKLQRAVLPTLVGTKQ